MTKEHITIYEVQEGSNIMDTEFTGLVLRNEEIYYSSEAGYIGYYRKDGDRIGKEEPIYSVDDSGEIYDVFANGETTVTLSEANRDEVTNTLHLFYQSYSEDTFYKTYDLKEEASDIVAQLLSETMISNKQQIEEETGITTSYHMVNSNKSGIITYYMDNFEGLKPENITIEMFNQEAYQKTKLKSTEMLTTNSPVYKLVLGEDWSIILPITPEQYQSYQDTEYIDFTILKDDFKAKAKFSLFQNGQAYYAKLDLNKFISRYIDDRYLDVELSFTATDGLKIPLSSIVEKDFYLVPIEYLTKGGNSNSDGLIKESYSEKGDVTLPFVETDIYYQDEEFAYIDKALFEPGTWIRSATGSDRYQLNVTEKLTGVYNVNMGYAVFRRIEILTQNEEYYIVKKNTSNGISAYDHIALDSSTAIEQEIIY
jgi:hypothetical protein